jgi:hypothetical protein
MTSHLRVLITSAAVESSALMAFGLGRPCRRYVIKASELRKAITYGTGHCISYISVRPAVSTFVPAPPDSRVTLPSACDLSLVTILGPAHDRETAMHRDYDAEASF